MLWSVRFALINPIKSVIPIANKNSDEKNWNVIICSKLISSALTDIALPKKIPHNPPKEPEIKAINAILKLNI